jgi:predicted nucleotidyltransferase
MNDLRTKLADICRRYGVTSLYVFGSRASEVAARVSGEEVVPARPQSDGDFAVQITKESGLCGFARGGLLMDLEELFELPRADLVVLNDVDPFIALEAVRGELLFCADPDVQAEEELFILRRAGDLEPFETERIRLVLAGELRR